MKRLVLFNGGLKSLFLAELAKREGEVILCYIVIGFATREDRTEQVSASATRLDLSLEIITLVESPPLEEVLLRMLYLTLQVLPIAKRESCKEIYHGLSQDDDPRIIKVIDPFVKQLNDLIVLAQPLYDGMTDFLRCFCCGIFHHCKSPCPCI